MISIRTRLTLIFTLAIFVIFSLVTILLYWSTLNLLYKADYEFLADEVDTVSYLVEGNKIDLKALKNAIINAPLEPDGSIYKYYVRVKDEQGRLLVETPGASDLLTAERVSTKSHMPLPKRRYAWMDKNDIHYLVIQSPIKFGRTNKYGSVDVAVDVSYQHEIFHSRQTFLIALFLGTLVALAIGFLIAHRGVRSFYLLAQKVQKITATSLDQRIDPKKWPRELSGLVIAFNQMLDRIESSVLRLKQFSSDLSHEMRTPITNMIGQTEISLSYDCSSDEYRNVLESNLEELQRIASLIENILFLARAENPQMDLNKVPLQIREEIALVIDYFHAVAEEKNIKIFHEGNAYIQANQVMIRRMLSNLISNAIKFSHEGGVIRFITCEMEDDMVQILLHDNGVGIAHEHLAKLCDRFYRIETTRNQNPNGTGLGLSIVKSIVEIHQGTLTIQSQFGKGTIIAIRLPK